MAATIILLYALNASTPIPVGCFIAAWILLGVETICNAINQHKDKNK